MFEKNYLKLFLISFLFLFLELLVIRIVSTEIRIFAYMSNLVLLAIFTGSGLGMLVKKKWLHIKNYWSTVRKKKKRLNEQSETRLSLSKPST